MHEAQNLLQAAKCAFLVGFPKHDLTKEAELHRLLEHSCRIETYPRRLSLGISSKWVTQDSRVSMVPLSQVKLALDRLACSWHVAVTSRRDRFCFTSALLDSLSPLCTPCTSRAEMAHRHFTSS